MRISEERQSEIDFDWYAVDVDGLIGVFSTDCTKLPESVACNERDYANLHHFFRGFVRGMAEGLIVLDTKDLSENIRSWAESPVHWNNFGFYVFDKDDSESSYEKESTPKVPLKLDLLPKEIRDIISRTRIPVSFKNCEKVDISIGSS